MRALAERLGSTADPETQVLCVDSRRQWRRMGNLRYDVSVRSALWSAAAPLRWLRRRR